MTEDLLRAARAAAERGWHVFPLRPGTKRPALHGETACPRTGPCTTGHLKWEDRATTDPARIHAAWSRAPYNIGIAAGPSGLVVIDLDMPKNTDQSSTDAPCGATAFAALCERTGQPVPRTRTVRTASGGSHQYFTAPAAARLHNTAGTLAPLVDTRAWGGYVVAAGSLVDGARYETTGPALLRPLPDWLKQLLMPPHPITGPGTAPVRRHHRPYIAAALSRETTAVTTAREGQRNTTLLRAARALGRFIATHDLTRPEVETALQSAGERAGLPAAECRTTIRSALDWSLTHNQPTRRDAA